MSEEGAGESTTSEKRPTSKKRSTSKTPVDVEDTASNNPEWPSTYRAVAAWFFLIISAVVTVLLLVYEGRTMLQVVGEFDARLSPDRVKAVVGLPVAAVASLFIVLVCEVGGREKMKFQGLGFKFEGASSQVIL